MIYTDAMAEAVGGNLEAVNWRCSLKNYSEILEEIHWKTIMMIFLINF